jgi:hypothetical protein
MPDFVVDRGVVHGQAEPMHVQQPELVRFSLLTRKRIEVLSRQHLKPSALQARDGCVNTKDGLKSNIETCDQHHDEFPTCHIVDSRRQGQWNRSQQDCRDHPR